MVRAGLALKVVLALAGALSLLTAAPRAGAAEPDPWLGRDKALHFGFSAAIAGSGYGATALATTERRPRFVVGGSLALAAGVGKEAWDAWGAGDASARDLAWDVAGTVTGLGVAWLIDWLISR